MSNIGKIRGLLNNGRNLIVWGMEYYFSGAFCMPSNYWMRCLDCKGVFLINCHNMVLHRDWRCPFCSNDEVSNKCVKYTENQLQYIVKQEEHWYNKRDVSGRIKRSKRVYIKK